MTELDKNQAKVRVKKLVAEINKYDDQKNLLSYVGASGKEDFLTFDKLGEYQKIEHK